MYYDVSAWRGYRGETGFTGESDLKMKLCRGTPNFDFRLHKNSYKNCTCNGIDFYNRHNDHNNKTSERAASWLLCRRTDK